MYSYPTPNSNKETKLKKGDIFSREVLRQDVNRIMDRYDGMARPFASVVPLFNIDPEKKTVAITIEIQEGGEVTDRQDQYRRQQQDPRQGDQARDATERGRPVQQEGHQKEL